MERTVLQQFLAWLEEQGYTICSWSYNDDRNEPADLPNTALIEQFLRQQQSRQRTNLYPSAGYDYQIVAGDFCLPAKNVEKALKILNSVYGERKAALEEWFRTIDVQLVTNGVTFDIIGLQLDMEHSRQDQGLEHMLSCIASCVAPRSRLRFVNTDGTIWSVVFVGKVMQEV